MWRVTYETKVVAEHWTEGQLEDDEIAHEHTWDVAITFQARGLDGYYQAVDRVEVGAFLRGIRWDWGWGKKTLNLVFDENPTPEFLAQQVYWRALEAGLLPVLVRVSDGDGIMAEYTEVYV